MKQFFVIGNRTSKSLSPAIFNYWFAKYKIQARYYYIETKEKDFDKTIVKELKNKDVFGINVTIPYKEKIIKHLDTLDKHSKYIGAVNCITNTKYKKKGSNTDWSGYYKTLPKGFNLKKSNIIIIGYGGAAQAIHYSILKNGAKKIKIFNRTKKRVKFSNKIKYTLNLKTINEHLGSSDLIINTAPKNLIKKHDQKKIGKQTILSDIVYKPKITTFLKQFPDNKKIFGITMLLEQAILSFKIWFGFAPKVDKKLLSILNRLIK